MAEHECIHEVDFAKMSDKIDALLSGQGDVKETLHNLDTTIRGNGKEGLKTQVALNRQSLNRIWWVIGVMVTIFGGGSFGIVWWILKKQVA